MLCMATFTEHETAFINATAFHIEKDWKGQKGLFAGKIGISGGYLSEIIGRKKCPQLDKQEKIAKELGYKNVFEFVEFGKKLTVGDLVGVMPKFQMQGVAYTPPLEPRYSDKIPPPADCNVCDLQKEATKRHAVVIEGFQNHELATEINQYLVEIERLEGTTGLEYARRQISFLLNEAREKKGLAPLQKTGTGTGSGGQ